MPNDFDAVTPTEQELLAVDGDARLLFGKLCELDASWSGSGPKVAVIRGFLAKRDAARKAPPGCVIDEDGRVLKKVPNLSSVTPGCQIVMAEKPSFEAAEAAKEGA